MARRGVRWPRLLKGRPGSRAGRGCSARAGGTLAEPGCGPWGGRAAIFGRPGLVGAGRRSREALGVRVPERHTAAWTEVVGATVLRRSSAGRPRDGLGEQELASALIEAVLDRVQLVIDLRVLAARQHQFIVALAEAMQVVVEAAAVPIGEPSCLAQEAYPLAHTPSATSPTRTGTAADWTPAEALSGSTGGPSAPDRRLLRTAQPPGWPSAL